MIKTVSVEAMRTAGKLLPPNMHSVPALMLLPGRELMFGKAVFDYLLLPGRGKLLTPAGGVAGPPQPQPPPGPSSGAGPSSAGDPMAFGFGSGLADQFAPIEDSVDGAARDDRAYGWSSIEDMTAASASIQQSATVPPGGSVPLAPGMPRTPPIGMTLESISAGDLKGKKKLPSLEELRRARESQDIGI